MSDSYTPPKVWSWDNSSDEKKAGQFAKINRPTAGARQEKALAKGQHDLQLYSLATPNGVKVTLMLEELLQLGCDAEYDAWPVNIMSGEQFGSGFVAANPNSKIPALVDHSLSEPLRIFESGSILVYLAEKFGKFLPSNIPKRTEVMNWLMWQMGATPLLGGGFGHFYAYAPEPLEYPIDRFAMEVKRQLDVLDRQLADNEFIAGNEYSIADIAIAPWYGALLAGELYNAAEFLSVHEYAHVERWRKQIFNRAAYPRAAMVNRTWGEGEQQLPERHSAADIDAKLAL